MIPVLNIGPFVINTDWLIILLGLWIGILFCEKYASFSGLESKHISNIIYYSLIGGVVGARLGYIGQYLSIFLNHPLSMLSLKPVMLDLETGLLTACIVGYIYIQKNNIDYLCVLDALVPGLSIFFISLGFAHLASGNAYGIQTDLPWGIYLWQEIRHPTQIYEIISAVIIMVILWPRKNINNNNEQFLDSNIKGYRAFLFLALYAFSRIFISTFIHNTEALIMNIRRSQLFWWIILILCLYQTYRLLSKANNSEQSLDQQYYS